jgi:hypothetical protein
MSAEPKGRRWAGTYAKPMQDYVDTLLAALEADAPLDHHAASLRFDELACMRRTLAVAAAGRAAMPPPAVVESHDAAAPPVGKCAAAVDRILGRAARPERDQPMATLEDGSLSAVTRTRAELALRRRALWSDAGERAACDLLGRWNGEYQRLVETSALQGTVGVVAEVMMSAKASSQRQAGAGTHQRTDVERRAEEGWAAAWSREGRPPPQQRATESHNSRTPILRTGGAAAGCGGTMAASGAAALSASERFTAGGATMCPAEAAAAATASEAAAAALPPMPTTSAAAALSQRRAHGGAHAEGPPLRRRRRWFKVVAVVMSRRGGRESHRFVDIVNGVSEFHFGRTTTR